MMMQWKEYEKGDRTKEPPSHTEFLILNGTSVNIASHAHDRVEGYQWWLRDGSLVIGVTHYAEINLPLKEPE